MRMNPRLRWLLAGLMALALPGCSVKMMAINSLGNALAEGTSSYATDDDPELVREAVPFGLKTIEGLLEESPRHKGLLTAATSGFTQYGYAFIQQQADFVEDEDFDRAMALRARARGLYRRALGYGLRGLEAEFKGFEGKLRADPDAALARARKKNVPLLFWTGNAWGAAISISKDDPELTADQNLAEALMRRALELDEGYDYGSIHDFFISYEGARQSVGGAVEQARSHFERAMALGRGKRAWPLVNLAETVSVADQNRDEFMRLLTQALELDVDGLPEHRLTNLIAQSRARWLLGRVDDLFIE